MNNFFSVNMVDVDSGIFLVSWIGAKNDNRLFQYTKTVFKLNADLRGTQAVPTLLAKCLF